MDARDATDYLVEAKINALRYGYATDYGGLTAVNARPLSVEGGRLTRL